MAFRRPQRLTCPGCDMQGQVTWLIGAGPTRGTGPNGATYTRVMENGPWQVETLATAPEWQGRVICPSCGQTVLERP